MADEILINRLDEETFPMLTQDFTLPFMVKNSRPISIYNFIFFSFLGIFQAQIVYSTFLESKDSKFVITIFLVILIGFFCIALFNFLKLIKPKVAIIQDTGIFTRVPMYQIFDFLMGKMRYFHFDAIYEIYYSEERDNSSFRYYLNICYIDNLSGQNGKNHRKLRIIKPENAVKQMVAISRTAMLNYHQKHNITNLPKIKLIQQK